MVLVMSFDELKDKAKSLPLLPGVYIMKDASGAVIYVGKAKKLKNRVSQYFQHTASHTPKTTIMVSKIRSFDVIVAASEFEALVLECALIKQHKPKYNILLKDDKGYPFLRVSVKDVYPTISIVTSVADDGAEYFGPFGSRGVTQALLKTVLTTLKLPSCTKRFPKDIGKDRPCLNYHMNQCLGWCREGNDPAEYKQAIEYAVQLLRGNYKSVAAEIKNQMLTAAENLKFELAAELRDRLRTIENLGKKQLVTATGMVDTDVIGYFQTEAKGCFSVLHYSDGNLLDKETMFVSPADSQEASLASLIVQFYMNRGCIPGQILLPFELDDRLLLEQYFMEKNNARVQIRVPQRGNGAHLVALALKNATEEVERITDSEQRYYAVLNNLGQMLSIPTPVRIESFDISNISGTDIVAGMVVFINGKPHPGAYKKFKMRDMPEQNDYAAMSQALERRFQRYMKADKGFDALPDLLLIDGGISHAVVALETLSKLGLSVPIFGMVKDDRHRTRALVTPEGEEISIITNQSIFSFIGTIQEETHRFAIGYHKKLRSKRLHYSELDSVKGIGTKRKQLLLKTFQSIRGIRAASVSDLERILPKDAANAVYQHFHPTEEI